MRKLKIVLAVLFVTGVILVAVKNILDHQKPVTRTKETSYPMRPEAPKPAPPPRPVGARMAIVLDDWGENYGLTKQALDIGRPLTLSILPYLHYSKKIAEEAHRNNLGVMLHMPMEPKKAHERMEPQTILTTTPDADVIRYLDEALGSIPYAEGVNNHTGSKATTDTRVMRLVLGRLKERGLFFVDSFVTKDTVGPDVAREIGLPFAKRGVFIDNVSKKDAILGELKSAGDIALKKGEVVVIGHDRKTTLAAIKEAVPSLEKAGVRLVLVRDLVVRQSA